MKVLIVDDNANDRKLLRLNLERHGCETVVEACDGQEGLEQARAQRPDLIISDALMPRLDGFEFLRMIKQDEELKATPFIFHSSVYTGLKDEELASHLGAEAFIPKAKEPEEFWREIAAILERLASGAKKALPSEQVEGEKAYLREYSGVVSAKLEQKVRELEESLARRKEAEAALLKSEQFLNTIIENIPDMIFVKDAQDLRFIRFNKAGEELLGYSRAELMGKNDHDFFPTQEADFFTEHDREVIDKARLVDIPEETILTRNKGRRLLHTKKIPIQDETGTPLYLLGISEDITERKQAEDALVKLSQAIEQSPAAIIITDAAGRIEFVNPKFTQMSGYSAEEVLGQNLRLMEAGETSPEEYNQLWKTVTAGKVWHGEFHNRKKDGEQYWEAATISPIRDREGGISHFVAIKEDITERKKLEAQLLQSQKMEAVGLLAGGVAHDFNNMLMAIIGYGNILQMKMAEDDPLRSNVDKLLGAADRAAGLTQSLLAFSRKQVIHLQPVNLNEIIRKVDKFLARIIGEDIEIRSTFMEEPLNVNADSGQIEQVLMNLATNARDAMPQGGLLSIVTESVEIDSEHIRHEGYFESGRYAVFSVTDSGTGMDPTTVKRLCEPFFTTKELGRGTGLGMSIVYGIVKQHGGFIEVYSEPGSGTTFRIHLPQLKGGEPVGTAPQPQPQPRKGTETILLAEDDAEIRKLSREVLTEFGYTVIEAADGEEAVRNFKEHRELIQLLLLDLNMPRKNGKDAFDEIRTMDSHVRAIFISGYPVDDNQRKSMLEAGCDLIMKPVSPQNLLSKIREVLER